MPTTVPRPLPVLGYALRFARAPLELIAALRSAGDVVRFRLGPQTIYWVNRPELVRQVLTDASTFDKGMQADKLRIVVGNGLVTSMGEHHLRHRRLVQPAFHRARIEGYVRTMREFTLETVDGWRDGERIEADREFARLTLRVVSKALFSTELANDAVDEVMQSMPWVMDGIGRRIRDPLGLRGRLPTPANRAFDASVRRLRAVVDRIVAGYRADGSDHGDVLSMLLMARDEDTGTGLTDNEVSDEVLTLLAAGHETTANALSWAMHHLGERPDLRVRAEAEVDTVIGDRPVTMADIPQLPFLHGIVNETLRLYPPAWILTRRTIASARLGDIDLPVGASVFFAPYGLQRDPAVYAQPDAFDPDRWSAERSVPRPSFVPFGGGRRQCIGDVFALTELVVVLATILQHWQLRPVPGPPVRIDSTSVLKPDHLPMTTHRRQSTVD
jgi:pentalenene oxygenase